MKRLSTPFTKEMALDLKAGDQILLTGVLYTGRDAAHKRMIEFIEEGIELPFDVQDQIIYYVGPTPARPGSIFGSGVLQHLDEWMHIPPQCCQWDCVV